MPNTRRTLKLKQRITPEAVEAFKAGDFERLYLALDLRPSDTNPLDVDQYDRQSPGWACAMALRAELERLAETNHPS